MKKLYSCFMLAMMAMVSSFVAKADMTVTLKIDDATRLTGYVQYQDPVTYSHVETEFTPEQLQAFAAEGGSSFTIPASYGYVYINATDGNTIVSALNETTGQEGYITGGTQTYFYVYGDATLSVTSADLASTRTATCTINVDDASKVSVSYATGSEIALVNGENTVKFNPNTETPFMVSAKNYGETLYQVLLGETEQTGYYGRYQVAVADGDVLTVNANYPDAPSVINFEYGENEAEVLGCFSVAVDGVAVEDFDGKTLTVKLGQKVTITGNTDLYNFNYAITVDGASTSFYGNYEFTATKAEHTISATVTKYASYNVTLTVDNAENVEVYVGNSNNTTAIESGVETEIALSASASNLTIKPVTGCYITSITVNGTEYSSSGYGSSSTTVRNLAEGDKVVVTTGKVVRDKKALVWVDDITKAEYGYSFYGSYDRSNVTLESGENEVVFGDVDNPFYAGFYVNGTSVSVWQNGLPVAPQYEGSTSYYLTFEDGDYWKIYLAETPESFAVAFNAEENTITSVTVAGKTYADWATGFTALKDTEVAFTVAANCTVKVNGVTATPVEGKYVVTLTEATEIVVKAPVANVFAYDLYSEWVAAEESVVDGESVAAAGTLTVNYSLNADATSVVVAVKNAEGEVVVSDANAGTTKGAHEVVLSVPADILAGTYTWDVAVCGDERGSVVEFASWKFYHPAGLDVDNSFESPSFGTLFVAEGYTDGSRDGYESTTTDGTDGSGLYIYDPTGEPVLSATGKARFFGQGLTHSHTLTDGTTTKTSGSDFRSVAVAEDGRIFVTRYNNEGDYILSASNLDELVNAGEFTTSLVAGMTMTDTKVYNDAEGNFLAGPMQSFDVKGGGEETKLIAMTRASNQVATGSSLNRVVEYSLGTANALTVAEPFAALDAQYTISYDKSASLAYDSRGGVWYCQYRGTPDDTNPALVYVDAEGNTQYFEGVGGKVRRRAGLAVSPDAKTLVAASASGEFTVYGIEYAEDGKVSLTEKYVVSHGMGGNLYAMAIDCAGNVYGGSASLEFVKGFALPHAADEAVVTKAASKYAFEIKSSASAIEEVGYDKAVNNNVYNLQGMLLIENATEAEINALPAGLYIINGKKVVRK